MITAAEKKKLRVKLEQYEGKISHMYLDTKGYVTVGVGHLLSNVAAAQKLAFVHQDNSSKKATKDEIKTDYETVKKQKKGFVASLYKKHTKLKLSDDSIDELTNKHIETFEKELKKIYGNVEFTAYPQEVRLALFDMIFNLGMPKLKNQYKNFNKHIKAKKWADAASESKRNGIGAARNKYVKDLLEKAANAEEKKKPTEDKK